MQESRQKLQKAISDVSYQIDKYYDLESTSAAASIIEEDLKQAECQCCGLKEDCTVDYITQVEDCYCGNWVCGLCSEAVNERLKRGPKVDMQEAVSNHREFCQIYNATTRLNPKLSLTRSMRDIVKRRSENRNSMGVNKPKIARSISYP
ncbi:hypothetical protein L6164_015918 [Bauhinia variegata]|uniref:Uncharacterized protein n=1 Tax=Bauhinia variegata TaxID=167791 RepID=A0ACB9NNF5_BAUVA|nr:hypothetical protein L6164_015918 [Bauhinia variegata]